MVPSSTGGSIRLIIPRSQVRVLPGPLLKYDAVWQQNQVEFQTTGQGGVPTMSFNGEPFFGQDRFDQFFWRLRENGLTQRKVRREPMVTRPMRWPISGAE